MERNPPQGRRLTCRWLPSHLSSQPGEVVTLSGITHLQRVIPLNRKTGGGGGAEDVFQHPIPELFVLF